MWCEELANNDNSWLKLTVCTWELSDNINYDELWKTFKRIKEDIKVQEKQEKYLDNKDNFKNVSQKLYESVLSNVEWKILSADQAIIFLNIFENWKWKDILLNRIQNDITKIDTFKLLFINFKEKINQIINIFSIKPEYIEKILTIFNSNQALLEEILELVWNDKELIKWLFKYTEHEIYEIVNSIVLKSNNYKKTIIELVKNSPDWIIILLSLFEYRKKEIFLTLMQYSNNDRNIISLLYLNQWQIDWILNILWNNIYSYQRIINLMRNYPYKLVDIINLFIRKPDWVENTLIILENNWCDTNSIELQ